MHHRVNISGIRWSQCRCVAVFWDSAKKHQLQQSQYLTWKGNLQACWCPFCIGWWSNIPSWPATIDWASFCWDAQAVPEAFNPWIEWIVCLIEFHAPHVGSHFQKERRILLLMLQELLRSIGYDKKFSLAFNLSENSSNAAIATAVQVAASTMRAFRWSDRVKATTGS